MGKTSKEIAGTRCEMCDNRVLFDGCHHCTVATCKPTIDEFDCFAYHLYFYDWDMETPYPCKKCERNGFCPYQSESFPLAYGN